MTGQRIPSWHPPLNAEYLKVHMRGADWREPKPDRFSGFGVFLVGLIFGAGAMWVAIGGVF